MSYNVIYRRMNAVVLYHIGNPKGVVPSPNQIYQTLKLFSSLGHATRYGAMCIMLSLLRQGQWRPDYNADTLKSTDFNEAFDSFFADFFGDGCEYEWQRDDSILTQSQLDNWHTELNKG